MNQIYFKLRASKIVDSAFSRLEPQTAQEQVPLTWFTPELSSRALPRNQCCRGRAY